MPMYDYRCLGCGQTFEVFLRSAGMDPLACPSCGSDRMERLPSAFHMLNQAAGRGATTCCGRDSRCASPPCSADDVCRRR
jgi:putative FmdB family regulatory protein